jgi:ABC-type antimicrobial peptide transport system permease subunit
MAIGMACAILLIIIIQFNLSSDRFRENSDCLFRVNERHFSNGKLEQTATTPTLLAATLKEKFPEIIRSTRFFSIANQFPKEDDIVEGRLSTVDQDFFEMFEIEFVQGNAKSALNRPYDIVLTEEMANRYFGNENPMGKTMAVWPNSIFTVTGVIKKQPLNSTLHLINSIISFESWKLKFKNIDTWASSNNMYTYIELKKGTDRKWVEKKIINTIQENSKDSNAEIFLQNVKRIALHSQEISNSGEWEHNLTYVKLEILSVFLFLIIASINFMNMTTAQTARRAKEIGVRKVAGASRRKIIFQFLGETLLIVFAAHIIAMIMAELMLPSLNTILYNELTINYKSVYLYLGLIALIAFCGLLAGIYPAFYLSSLKPLNIMKGVIDKNTGKTRLRRVLVIFQFVMSFLLIISTLIVRSQLGYIQNKNIGMNIQNICYFQYRDINYETLKKDLSNNPDILGISITSQNPIYNQETTNNLNWEGKNEGDQANFYILRTDEEYAKIFQPVIGMGRFFSSEFSMDNDAVVINESALKTMGFKDPIGKVVSYNGLNLKIIGVLKDFHFQPLYSRIEPMIILKLTPSESTGICNVRIKPNSMPSTDKYIREVLHSYHLDYPVNIGSPVSDYDWTYRMERVISSIVGSATFLAIIISCLGLVGLSTFMTLHRTKEIGIRKANGAKTIEIFAMLSKEYFSIITISFAIASPIAWYIMNIWLQSFAYKTNIGWWVFALAWIIVMVITLFTVGFQSYKTANKNPVEALRYE